MAIYHLNEQAISKTQGRNPLAMAAYRAADRVMERIFDQVTGLYVKQCHDYTKKQQVLYQEIMAPDYAPSWMRERAELWQRVMEGEKRKDAVYLQEMNVAIPIELTPEQGVVLVKEFVQDVLVAQGMVVDVAVHWDKGNPHAHLMQSTREIVKGGFGAKNRTWHRKEGLQYKRKMWAEICNRHLLRYGFDVRVDHRSYKAQGIDMSPSIHEGVAAGQLEVRGQVSNMRELNRRNIAYNLQAVQQNPELLLKKIASQRVTFTKADIIKELGKMTQSDMVEITSLLQGVMEHPSIERLVEQDMFKEARFVYKPYYQLERQMLANVQQMRQVNSAKPDRILKKLLKQAKSFNEEQKEAIQYLCDRNQQLGVLVGKAGTGKSSILDIATDYYQRQNYQVKGAALAGIAAVGLQGKAKIESRTIASWNLSWERGYDTLSNQDMLIVDEAGMIDTATMQGLIQRVKEAGAKLILVGDTDQLQPIAMGQALKGIVQKIGAVEITQVYRQKEEWMRRATEAFSNNQMEEGLVAYHQAGHIIYQPDKQQTMHALIHDYLRDREIIHKKRLDETMVIMAYRRNDVKELNRQIRDGLKQQGELQKSEIIQTAQGKQEFAVGDRILFLKNDRNIDVKNGMMGTIQQLDKGQFLVALDHGTQCRFDIEDYGYLTHGYAATIHKEQGVTVDRSYVLLDELHDRHSAYVGLTRHRQNLRVYVPKDKFPSLSDMVRTMSREGTQHLASDIIVPENEKGRYQLVQDYVMTAQQTNQLFLQIKQWATEQQCGTYEHTEWEKFNLLVKQRNQLASEIYQNPKHYKHWLKQARINMVVLKRHAGHLSIANLRSYEERENDMVQTYKHLVSLGDTQTNQTERLRLAYVIEGRMYSQKRLYEFLITHHQLDAAVLAHDAARFTVQLKQIPSLEGVHADERYAWIKTHMGNNKEHAIHLYQDMQRLRREQLVIEQRLNPYEKRLAQENWRIKQIHDEHIRIERFLARALSKYDRGSLLGQLMQEGVTSIYKHIKAVKWGRIHPSFKEEVIIARLTRYHDIQDMLVKATEASQLIKQQVEYKTLLTRQQIIQGLLGRFVHDHDMELLYRHCKLLTKEAPKLQKSKETTQTKQFELVGA